MGGSLVVGPVEGLDGTTGPTGTEGVDGMAWGVWIGELVCEYTTVLGLGGVVEDEGRAGMARGGEAAGRPGLDGVGGDEENRFKKAPNPA